MYAARLHALFPIAARQAALTAHTDSHYEDSHLATPLLPSQSVQLSTSLVFRRCFDMPALQNVCDGKDTREKDVASDLASATRKIQFDMYGPTCVGQVVRVNEMVSKNTFTTAGALATVVAADYDGSFSHDEFLAHGRIVMDEHCLDLVSGTLMWGVAGEQGCGLSSPLPLCGSNLAMCSGSALTQLRRRSTAPHARSA